MLSSDYNYFVMCTAYMDSFSSMTMEVWLGSKDVEKMMVIETQKDLNLM